MVEALNSDWNCCAVEGILQITSFLDIEINPGLTFCLAEILHLFLSGKNGDV